MDALIKPIKKSEGYKRLSASVRKNAPTLATGVIDSQKCHTAYALMRDKNAPALFITYSELKAREAFEDMQFFFGDRAYLYPSKDIIFYSADLKSADIEAQRFAAIEALLLNKNPVIVVSVEALFDRLVKKDIFKEYIFEYSAGDRITMDKFIEKLVFMGYERRDLVESAGQFAVRGGIIDIFMSINENAFRIELWGDEIDSIRILDSLSQRSVEKVDRIKLFPMRSLVYGDAELAEAIKGIRHDYTMCLTGLREKGLYEEANNLKSAVEEDLEKLSEFKSFPGVDKYIQYFYDETVTILNYFSNDALIFFDEPDKTAVRAENVTFEFEESIHNRILKGYMLPKQMNMVFSYAEILAAAKSFNVVLFSMLKQSARDFDVGTVCEFTVKHSDGFSNDKVKGFLDEGYGVIVLAGVKSRAMRLVKELTDVNIPVTYDDEPEELKKGIVTISKGSLCTGFCYTDIKLAILSDKAFFGQTRQRRSSSKKKKAARIETFTDLRVGDYIVHDNHGVGIFKGIEKIITDGISKDYMKLGYSDGGVLYVSANQMDSVQKFIGGDAGSPKLNKLGSAEWGKTKAKTKNAVQIIAKELAELYAKRQEAKGFEFSLDTVWQKEFEDLFPYQETEDQLIAIDDMKKDMESEKVMDRLICGDVGYGKTEIAIRGAFKAVQDGKQAAFLVPTTILAQQHYNTMKQRMKDFPVNIELLSRFRTPAEVKKAFKSITSGQTDIVVGTHMLLGKDIKFRDLGLLVVDEEQRFGVTHKEKLKRLKENVDVLTLTATPIPRTLHMSLSGIRDMSILEEAPRERRPIQTYVMEYNPEFVRDAIHRELARSGQVYYLYNRVRNIAEVSGKLQELVPEARIAYAHGQMSERELENIMMDFIDYEIDVLVCTTIIETGMDIPNVNTIIIQDADKMGLAQLYQLRGRVGRSNKTAYAYLMYKKDKVLMEIAEKRLQTIREFTELGSGFKIAMRDLEIRGAGNLLGAEQHGHIMAVGYDMYCRLLEEAINEIGGDEQKKEFETSIDINISAFIPSYYIENEEQKLEIYKKISLIKSVGDFSEIQEEIEDRYGDLPKSVQNLLDIALLKEYAHCIGIAAVTQKQNNYVMSFKMEYAVSEEKIIGAVKSSCGKLMYTAGDNPYLTYVPDKNEGLEPLKLILCSMN